MTTDQTRREADINVVGLGIKAIQQITREAEDVLRRSRQIFFVDAGFGVEEFLSSLCTDVQSMLNLYKEGGDRRLTYRSMATRVIEAALDGPPVCFATYGHPQMYVYPTRLLRDGGAVLDLEVAVFPGVSALDTMMNDLNFDPGPQGLQMYEATDALARDRPLQPDVPCLLWQVAAVETAMYSEKRGNMRRFERLQNYLLRTYPADHEVTMVVSSTYRLLPSQMDTFPVRRLAERLSQSLQHGTLYIPPVGSRPVHDMQVLQDTYDPRHLARVTST